MFDFVPIDLYQPIYNSIVGLFLCLFFFNSYCDPDFVRNMTVVKYTFSYFIFIFILLFLGARPISFEFGDMGNYNNFFIEYQKGLDPIPSSDFIFRQFMMLYADVANAELFFLTAFVLYFAPIYMALKKWFGIYWIWPFLTVVSLFSFYQYGVNGIRNGIATSLFLFAISQKTSVKYLVFMLAYGFHSSIILPIGAFLLFTCFPNIKYYYYGWFVCFILSSFSGVFGELIQSLPFLDSKISHYGNLDMSNDDMGKVGFRWDFIIFSIAPIVFSYWLIFKRNFYDNTYILLLAIYLISNSFWLLIIRIPFSNRFAYLSWFIYGVVFSYPFLKFNFLINQNRYFSILVIFLFTLSLFIS